MINVLLVDDHELVRAGIKRIIEAAPGIRVVGETRDGEAAIRLAKELQPHIILQDLKMPGPGPCGLPLLQKLLHLDSEMKIIIMTSCDNETFPPRLLRAGAMGYLTKDISGEELVRAIQMVQTGQRYVPAKIAQEMAIKSSSGLNKPLADVLSNREYDIMVRLIKGFSVQKIAQALGISHKTVNTYRYRLFEKLKINNNVELAQFAIHNNLLDPEQRQ